MDANTATAPPPGEKGRNPAKGDRPSFGQVVEYGVMRVLSVFLRHVPVGIASAAVGYTLGTIMPLTPRNKQVLENMAFAMPELSDAERLRMSRAMWHHLGRVIGEAFQIDRLVKDRSRVEFPANFEAFKERVKDGAICPALHLGNWEISGILPREAGLKLSGVYQKLHNPLVETYLRRMRDSAYPAGLFAKGPHVGPALIALARQGVAVGLVSDFREMRGIGVNFFGQPAFATPLPAMLARMTGKPMIAGAVVRTKGAHFRAMLEEVPVNVTEDRDRDIAEATQALHDVFERWIREAPEQWMWTHRKWARSRRRTLTVGDTVLPPLGAEEMAMPEEAPASEKAALPAETERAG
ncbi:lysophospholipid acyltransferase family protein [Acuticoccus kandeliae]|uniref:lysophospholipid acyltransferase family protein n=1 Tax=Acuticoccus kandeliae TaxID=2073160 RepID=UPI000D3E5C84|nr:lauroyl acyltransferase [Acuticoccus kandeliae]